MCELKTAIQSPPEAHDDYSTIQENTTVEKLVTLNDFFTTDVVVTIVTNGTNGVATVLADGKTLKYIPNTNWFGNDTITYKITDANLQESTAVWHITVTDTPVVSCSTVTPNYNADAYSVGSNLQIAITNLSDIGANVLTGETYIIAIRNSSNVILHSYTVTGTMTSAPTIWTSPIPIANDWDNFTIEQSITTQSSTGALCGTVTFEREDPFSLNDVAISWFDGTTPPACLNFLIGDNEIEKKDKLMNKVCSVSTQVDANTAAIAVIPNPADYIDISSGATVVSPFVLSSLKVLEYASGRVVVDGWVSYPSTVGRDADIITGLPVNANINEGIFHARLQGDTDAIAQLKIYGTGGIIRNGISTLPDLNTTANTEMVFHYEYQKG